MGKQKTIVMSLYASKGFHDEILVIWNKTPQRKKARAILIALAEDARRTGSIDFEDYYARLEDSELGPDEPERIDLYVDATKYPDLVDLWNRTLAGTRSSTFLMLIQGAINQAKAGRGLSIQSLSPSDDIHITAPAKSHFPDQPQNRGRRPRQTAGDDATRDLFESQENPMDMLVNSCS